MDNDPGEIWNVGVIANGHVLTRSSGWVPLNPNAPHAGPWRPGDVVNDHAFTGDHWVVLPASWRPDPTRRNQFRWWTGQAWSQQVMNDGVRFDELVPSPAPLVAQSSAPARASLSFWEFVGKAAVVLYCGSWLFVAIYAALMAYQENQPKHLMLASTASMNVFLYKLTGKTRSELKQSFRAAMKPKIPYLLCGALAAGGVWLSLHFDDSDILYVTLAVVLLGLMIAWVFS